jgi:RNA polymerase sigma factor (sigma-70 family)
VTHSLASIDLVAESERAWLVRYCARLSGQPESAEDIAQETLLEAWRNRHKLSEPAGRLNWLAAIARHVAQRWARAHGRDLQRLAPLEEGEDADQQPWMQDSADFEYDLERAELAALLDRALALLPAETRLALIAHYIEDMPQTEVAARLGLSVGTLGVRLHRGKLALRQLFANELREEAAAFGLGSASGVTWQELTVWCPLCGQQRLQGCLDPSNAHLLVRCPACSLTPFIDHRTSLLKGALTCRAAFNRVFDWATEYFPPAMQRGSARCMGCGRMAPIRRGLPFLARPRNLEEASLHIACTCPARSTSDLAFLALASQEGRRFFRAHPRIRLLPLDEQEVEGVPALRASFISLTETARLDLLAARDTLRPLQIDTTP